MQKLKKQLLNLALGELAALIVFIFLYLRFDFGRASFMAFTYLIFILLQGSIYWFYRYRLIVDDRKVDSKVIVFLKWTRKINMLLLLAIGIALPFVRSSMLDFIIAIGIFLFGTIEYINYYWYRLSYGKSGFNLRLLFSQKLKESSINKLISNQ